MAVKRDIEAEQRQLAAAVAAARARLAGQSTEAIRKVRQNAENKGVAELVEACDAELSVRGGHELTAEQAAAALEVARELGEAPLEERIVAAFSAVPPNERERELLRVLAERPGASYTQIHRAFAHADTAKVAGAMVSDRFGWFRTLPSDEERAGAVIVKSAKGRQVTWELSPAARHAFVRLHLIEAAA